jgi:hypothetical protein
MLRRGQLSDSAGCWPPQTIHSVAFCDGALIQSVVYASNGEPSKSLRALRCAAHVQQASLPGVFCLLLRLHWRRARSAAVVQLPAVE